MTKIKLDGLNNLFDSYQIRIWKLKEDYDPIMDSNFDHVSSNLTGMMKQSSGLLKEYYGKKDKEKRFKEMRDIFVRNSSSLEYYLRLIKSNEKFRDLEMKTNHGYFGKASYDAVSYVEKLKKQKELK